MTVSSMSLRIPVRTSSPTMKTGASTVSDPWARMRMVCQPLGRLASTTWSTTPPRSARTWCSVPSISTTTSTSVSGTLVKLRQPRTTLSPASARLLFGSVRRTRQRTRTQRTDP